MGAVHETSRGKAPAIMATSSATKAKGTTMAKYYNNVTIASEADYADWTDAVHKELKARNLDIQTAYDYYSFDTAYHEFGDKPRKAVEDYQMWMEDTGYLADVA